MICIAWFIALFSGHERVQVNRISQAVVQACMLRVLLFRDKTKAQPPQKKKKKHRKIRNKSAIKWRQPAYSCEGRTEFKRRVRQAIELYLQTFQTRVQSQRPEWCKIAAPSLTPAVGGSGPKPVELCPYGSVGPRLEFGRHLQAPGIESPELPRCPSSSFPASIALSLEGDWPGQFKINK